MTDLPAGLTLSQAEALVVGRVPWWHVLLGQLPMWCPVCHRPVFPLDGEPRNAWGLAAHVEVAVVPRGGVSWVVVACCETPMAQGRRMEDAR